MDLSISICHSQNANELRIISTFRLVNIYFLIDIIERGSFKFEIQSIL